MIPAHLEGLNPEQMRAVETIGGPILILAGAGSGKTRVLTRRIAHLLHTGVPPWQILAVTFTNKAAAEMKERVEELVGEGARSMLVSTFHSAAVRFLRRDVAALGIRSSFTIYDADDQKRLLTQVSADMGFDRKAHPPQALRSRIDAAKVRMIGPGEYAQEFGVLPGDPTPRVYAAYSDHLRAHDALDFNDLLNVLVRLFRERPEVLERYRNRYRYLLVDEYQDTNRAQYLLVKMLAEQHRNLCVVGDDDQSIYAFRGADIRNILDFNKDFPEAQTVRLEQNYRSTGNILKASGSIVAHNTGRMGKDLWTDVGDGEKVGLIVGQDDEAEAEAVLRQIRQLMRGGDLRYGDVAIIYRTNAASRAFEHAFVRNRIPHVLVGARRFFERREIRDVVAYLKLVLNPADDMAFLRVINVPARGLGPKAIEAIRADAEAVGVPLLAGARRWAAGSGKSRAGARDFCDLLDQLVELARDREPGALVEELLLRSGYRASLEAQGTEESIDRLANLAELVRALEVQSQELLDDDAEALDRLQAVVDRASLAAQADELPDHDEQGAVTLLTAHLAKGLEFPVVFVAGMFEGGFPHFRARDSADDLEEERRLVYVACTRAMKRLFLTRPRRRMAFGQGFSDVEPSRFLREIPREVAQHGEGGPLPLGLGSAGPREARPAQARLGFSRPEPAASYTAPEAFRTTTPEGPSDLQPGTKVVHPQFGPGVIRRCEGAASNLKIHVHFDRVGRKTLFARFANLEIVIS